MIENKLKKPPNNNKTMVKAMPLAVLMPAMLSILAPVAIAQSYTFFMEPHEGLVELEIKHPAISVHKIYFNLTGHPDKGFMIRIDKLENDLEWVHDYFSIGTSGLQAEPEPVVIDLKVNKTWTTGQNVDLTTIALSVHDGIWKRLDAIPYAEDSDFLYYRAVSPKLQALFALSGEPVPVEIRVSSPCNGNDVCEPQLGEDEENCHDCISLAQTRCIPSERYCSGDYLLECSEDGSEYTLRLCSYGCAGDACLLSTAGMAVALNPVIVTVVAVMLAVIILLTFLVKRMRSELLKIEERKESHEEVKRIVKKKH
jgi:hypothetical protein